MDLQERRAMCGIRTMKALDEAQIIKTIEARPEHQSVVLTGRGGGSGLKALADTVSEVKEVKHAFRVGIKARKGVDY